MSRLTIRNEYLSYLKSLVCDQWHSGKEYSKLFNELYKIEFIAIIPMDENRIADAIEMRVNYERNNGYFRPVINDPPSVLEVMVSLAVRCEDCIMGNCDYGDRTPVWFWYMIESIGLLTQINKYFDSGYVNSAVKKMINRDYSSNGQGGMFYIPSCSFDLRTIELWYQMNFWLNSLEDE